MVSGEASFKFKLWVAVCMLTVALGRRRGVDGSASYCSLLDITVVQGTYSGIVAQHSVSLKYLGCLLTDQIRRKAS